MFLSRTDLKITQFSSVSVIKTPMKNTAFIFSIGDFNVLLRIFSFFDKNRRL